MEAIRFLGVLMAGAVLLGATPAGAIPPPVSLSVAVVPLRTVNHMQGEHFAQLPQALDEEGWLRLLPTDGPAPGSGCGGTLAEAESCVRRERREATDGLRGPDVILLIEPKDTIMARVACIGRGEGPAEAGRQRIEIAYKQLLFATPAEHRPDRAALAACLIAARGEEG